MNDVEEKVATHTQYTDCIWPQYYYDVLLPCSPFIVQYHATVGNVLWHHEDIVIHDVKKHYPLCIYNLLLSVPHWPEAQVPDFCLAFKFWRSLTPCW